MTQSDRRKKLQISCHSSVGTPCRLRTRIPANSTRRTWVRMLSWNRKCRDGVQGPMASWTSRAVIGQTSGEPAQRAFLGIALAATSSAREVGPAQGLSRPERSARLASSASRHATRILKADHAEAAARNAAVLS